MGRFIRVRSPKFAPLPGEGELIVNEGMYGKALAEYLKAALTRRGWDAPFSCAEDWGWWVELRGAPAKFGACIYSGPDPETNYDYCVTDGAAGDRVWSWRRFRTIDLTSWIQRLENDLLEIFAADPDVETIGTCDDMPY